MNAATAQARLLLVDDDAVFVEILARALARHGFTVETAREFRQALMAIENQRHDFAVIDLRCPVDPG